jgi:hypothetical protein
MLQFEPKWRASPFWWFLTMVRCICDYLVLAFERKFWLFFGHLLRRWRQQVHLKHSYLPWLHVSKDRSLEDTWEWWENNVLKESAFTRSAFYYIRALFYLTHMVGHIPPLFDSARGRVAYSATVCVRNECTECDHQMCQIKQGPRIIQIVTVDPLNKSRIKWCTLYYSVLCKFHILFSCC